MKSLTRFALAGMLAALLLPATTSAGPIFLTGHDPDFHSQGQVDAASFFTTALDFVMGGTLNDNTHKLLWVESKLAPNSGHLTGANGLITIGLTAGIDYDVVNAAEFAAADLSQYTAIGVASTFGGMLTSAELNALIARSADIAAFVNSGRGIFASAECNAAECGGADNLTVAHGAFYSFLPVVASSIANADPYTLTAFGDAFGFTAAGKAYINECCTHNSFGLTGGLNVIDFDSAGHPTTLAGVFTIDDGGFHPVPEPVTMSMLAAGLIGFGLRRRNHNRSSRN
jgi:hypothetical protein